jgi:hypothetical protein
MYAAQRGVPFAEVWPHRDLDRFTNSDGWAAATHTRRLAAGRLQTRGNARAARTSTATRHRGWFDRDGRRGHRRVEPEIAGWTALVRTFPNLKTSTTSTARSPTPKRRRSAT